MADANLGRLLVRLGLDRREFERESRAARSQAQRLARDIRSSFAGAFAGIGAGLLTREIVQAARAAQQMQGALRVATGSSQAAGRELAFVRTEANRLGLELQSTGVQYAKFAAAARGSALAGKDARDIFTAVAEASTALSLSSEQTEGALRALEQMISKGNVQAEELRGQLGERIPGAFNLAARAIGVTTAELNDMLKAGEVTAERLLPALARELHATFGVEAANMAEQPLAEINRFKNALFELERDVAQGGFLKGLTDSLEHVGEILKDPAVRKGIIDLGDGIGKVVEFAASGLRHVDLIVGALAALAGIKLVGLVVDVGKLGFSLLALTRTHPGLAAIALVLAVIGKVKFDATAREMELLGLSSGDAAAKLADLQAQRDRLVASGETSSLRGYRGELADLDAQIKLLSDHLGAESLADFGKKLGLDNIATAARDASDLATGFGKAALSAEDLAKAAKKAADEVRDAIDASFVESEFVTEQLAREFAETSRLSRELGEQMAEDATRASEEASRAMQAPFIHASEGIQDALVGGFTSAFDEILGEADGFAGDLLNVLKRTVSELLVVGFTRPLLQSVAGGGLLGGGVVGGVGAGALDSGLSLDQVLAALQGGVAEGAEAGTSAGVSGALRALGGGGGSGGGGFSLGGLFGLGGGGGGGLGAIGGLGGLALPLLGFAIGQQLGVSGVGRTLITAGLTGAGLAGAGGFGIAGAIGSTGSLAAGTLGVIGTTLGTIGSLLGPIGIALAALGFGYGNIVGSGSAGAQAGRFAKSGENPNAGRGDGSSFRDTLLGTGSVEFAIAALIGAMQSLPRSSFGFSTRAGPGTNVAAETQSPFGFLGVDLASQRIGAQSIDFLNTIKALDEAVASVLNAGEIASVSARLQSGGLITSLSERDGAAIGVGFDRILKDRVLGIVEGLGGNSATFSANFLGPGGLPPAQGSLQALTAFLNGFEKFKATIKAISGEEMPALESTLIELANAAAEARAEFGPFGLDLAKIDAALAAGKLKAATDFLGDLGQAILAFTDPTSAALAEQAVQQERRLANARIAETEGAIGAIVAAERLGALEVARIREQAGKPITDLLASLTGSASSPLGLQAIVANAETAFNAVLASVQGGDLSKVGDLTAAASNLIDVSREAFGGSATFFEKFNAIIATLQNTLTGLPQFATGGSFAVPGAGGTDSQLVSFWASPGERVTIETAAQAARNVVSMGAYRSSRGLPAFATGGAFTVSQSTPGAQFFRSEGEPGSREIAQEIVRGNVSNDRALYSLQQKLDVLIDEMHALRRATEQGAMQAAVSKKKNAA